MHLGDDTIAEDGASEVPKADVNDLCDEVLDRTPGKHGATLNSIYCGRDRLRLK